MSGGLSGLPPSHRSCLSQTLGKPSHGLGRRETVMAFVTDMDCARRRIYPGWPLGVASNTGAEFRESLCLPCLRWRGGRDVGNGHLDAARSLFAKTQLLPAFQHPASLRRPCFSRGPTSDHKGPPSSLAMPCYTALTSVRPGVPGSQGGSVGVRGNLDMV